LKINKSTRDTSRPYNISHKNEQNSQICTNKLACKQQDHAYICTTEMIKQKVDSKNN